MIKKIYIICGPTACGKTGLGVQLAKKIDGEIINADSLQVYEDIPLLTALPTQKERMDVPHHLFGYLDAKSVCSVNTWLKEVKKVVDKVEKPIFVGGTGLYLKALIEGLSPIPDIPEEIRLSVRQMKPAEILKQLKTPVLHTDPQRLMRALEVEKATGKSILWWQGQPKIKTLPEAEFQVISIIPEREKLYQKCDKRFLQMINAGALKELVALLQKNPQKTGGVFQALGVKALLEFLEGTISFDEAVAQAQQETRHYAKRQLTWFRHQIKADVILSTPLLPTEQKI